MMEGVMKQFIGFRIIAFGNGFKGSLLGPQGADRKTQRFDQSDHLGFSKQWTIGGQCSRQFISPRSRAALVIGVIQRTEPDLGTIEALGFDNQILKLFEILLSNLCIFKWVKAINLQ